MKTLKYPSCDVRGSGKLNNDVSFSIIDLSAERIRFRAKAPIRIKSDVDLDFTLDGGLFSIHVRCNGRVTKAVQDGYEVTFRNILDEDKYEINELMKSSCDFV